MTRITIDWDRKRLEASGHAGAGAYGEDIVCAGISAITLTLLATLNAQARFSGMNVSHEVNEDTGELMLEARPATSADAEAVERWFEMATVGLRAIEQNYPGHLEIKITGRDKGWHYLID